MSLPKIINPFTSTYQKTNIMAKQGPSDRKKVNSSEGYELSHVAEKMGVSVQQVVGAKRATGSNDRKVIEKYISDKGKKK
ncbi:MAG: DUF3606 domain-containing protein [Pedobacter sp.]|nr:MAG: DUF3606 domain-containing protein [Pedobacter sp.]